MSLQTLRNNALVMSDVCWLFILEGAMVKHHRRIH